ncbi:MAG: DUF4387 domain-containing protein [Alphaproteobacteria bacterium]|nr:DUF4387 domain-containing protein [Alphaproteobacteria bacterium]NNF24665.1 DUF4387 family protein [Paracoccaceae bacterium]
MASLGQIAEKVRSKNAGPFWLTIDVFCGTPSAYAQVCQGLSTARVARSLGADPGHVKRFEIASLNVVKFSLPRPAVQGAPEDRDMHGASWAALLAELEINAGA